MRFLLIFLILCFPAAARAQTGSAQTTAALNAEVNTLFADNTSGQITPFSARQTLLDIIASAGIFTGTANTWTAAQAFNGGATAPTQSNGDNTTNVATTAFIQNFLGVAHTWTLLQTLSGGATAPTRSANDSTTNVATTAFVLGTANTYTAAQAFNGGATAPTQSNGDNTTNVATTAFIQNFLGVAHTWTLLQTLTGGATASQTGVFTNTQGNFNGQFILNSANPSTLFSNAQGGNHATEALTSAVIVPNTSTVYQVNAISGYIQSNAAQVSTGGYVGGYFYALANANNANMFGINPVVADVASLSGVRLQNEFDFVVNNTTTVVTGVTPILGGAALPTSATAFAVQVTGTQKWGAGFLTQDAAAFVGMQLGTNGTGNSVSSASIILRGKDAGGTVRSATFYGDLDGNPTVRTGQNNKFFVVQDFNGGAGANVFLSSAFGISVLPALGMGSLSGGLAGIGILLTSTSNFGIFPGTGNPTLSAAKGSLYMENGTGQLWVNTGGGTTWTQVTVP